MHKRIALIAALAAGLVAAGVWLRVFTIPADGRMRATVAAQTQGVSVPKTETAAPTSAVPKTVRVLIMPGHEPAAGGTSYGNVLERNLVVELGNDLLQYLRADHLFDATITRDSRSWSPTFATYFRDHSTDIIDWQKSAHREMRTRLASGKITLPPVIIDHNAATPDAALHLFGVVKWANENGADLIISLHFNDDRMSSRAAGTRSGFAMYVPVPQFKNGAASHAIAKNILTRLAAFNPVSDLWGERSGIVDDSQLIALGQDDTADVPSILIEYDYIYAPQYRDPKTRSIALRDLAYQTYLGLRDSFDKNAPDVSGTSVLPHVWRTPLTDSADVYALQTALILDGEWSPSDNACERNGHFGPCTRGALARFQKKYGISGENGFVGAKTLAKLNALFYKRVAQKRSPQNSRSSLRGL